MSEYRVSWEQAARRLGEDLSSDGPNGYGSFTPAQWLQWARGAVAGWKQRDAQWQHKWSRAVGTGTSNTLREADRADAAEARLKALEQQIGTEADAERIARALTVLDAMDEHDAGAAHVAALRAQGWQPIETAPKMRKVIVHYLNALGKHRTVMACYYLANALEMDDDYAEVGTYDEVTGNSYAPEGWYEEHDSDNPIMRLEGDPDSWMPLPDLPTEPTP